MCLPPHKMDLQSKKHNSTILQHTVKTSNNFSHISAGHLEELSWIYYPASFLRLVASALTDTWVQVKTSEK